MLTPADFLETLREAREESGEKAGTAMSGKPATKEVTAGPCMQIVSSLYQRRFYLRSV